MSIDNKWGDVEVDCKLEGAFDGGKKQRNFVANRVGHSKPIRVGKILLT